MYVNHSFIFHTLEVDESFRWTLVSSKFAIKNQNRLLVWLLLWMDTIVTDVKESWDRPTGMHQCVSSYDISAEQNVMRLFICSFKGSYDYLRATVCFNLVPTAKWNLKVYMFIS